jgi:hypothetical protein
VALTVDKRGLIDEGSTYDLDTGEVQEGALIWVPRKVPSRFGRSWFQMAQDSLRIINSHRKELGLEGIVVFNALMARLDFENFIQVSQSDIALELEMKSSNVSRAISRLVSLGFIRKGPKVGRSSTSQLHPELAWKGKPRAHFGAQQKAREAGWIVLEGGQDGS